MNRPMATGYPGGFASATAKMAVAIQQFSEVNNQHLAGELRLASATADITAPLQLMHT